MMIERLRTIVAEAEQLPPEEQEQVAARWEAILEEREWDMLTALPDAQSFHEALIAEAERTLETGDYEEIKGTTWMS